MAQAGKAALGRLQKNARLLHHCFPALQFRPVACLQGYITVSVTVVKCDIVPEVPVTVTV